MPPEILITPSSHNNQPDSAPIRPSSQENNVITPGVVVGSELLPAGADIRIDNVNKSLWQYVKKHKLWELIILLMFVIIWEIFLIILFIKYQDQINNSGSSGSNGYGYLIIAPFMVLAFWVYKLKKQFEAAFLEEFALANGYSFNQAGTVDETYGSIFRVKGRQSVSDVITGQYSGSDLRIFLYEDVIGYGRYQQKYQDTVIELDFHGELPDLLMVNNQSHFGHLNIAGSFGIKNKISLEGDFNKYFTLYAPQGNEVEALEVFSPDTMALMEDESKHYTVEFAGNRIYIYANGFVSTTDNLTQLFRLAKKLIEKLAPLASRLKNDSAIVAAPINIANNQRSYKFARKLGLIYIIAVSVIGIGITVGVLVFQKSPTNNKGNSISVLNSNNYAVDTTMPYCGAKPIESSPTLIGQFLNATINYNTARQPISSAIIAADYQANSEVMSEQISADQQYMANLQTLNFTGKAINDATNYENATQRYDGLLTQVQQELPNVSSATNAALTAARPQGVQPYINLRYDLGLPQSTCQFYQP